VIPDTYDAVDGQPLTVEVQRGEPLMTTYTASRGGEIFAATLKDGRRALTIEVDEISSMSGMLRPGDRIDLMLTAKPPGGDGNAKEFTFPMLSNVEVLATGQAQKGTASAGEAAARAYSHVTLNVTPQDATRVIAAKAGGKLTAVLRAPTDQVANPSPALTIDDVVASIAMLDAALQDPNNRAIAERVAQAMAQGDMPAAAPAAMPAQPPVLRDTPPPTQVPVGSRMPVSSSAASRGVPGLAH